MRMRRRACLLLAALWLAMCLGLTLSGQRQERAFNYEEKLRAARLMDGWMATVRDYKAQAGLAVSPEDLHGTGMIGEAYTLITTTSGALEAKRTTANPDMAALMVEILTQAGVRPGDAVGAGFSGSFPALDLAVLAACEAMDVECIYIASVGASTYGANQPELTLPDMLCRLYLDGQLKTPPALVTPGGQDDCGLDMDSALLLTILERTRGYGAEVMEEPDLAENLSRRMAVYGDIDCFVGVGGNLTTTGIGEKDVGYGLLRPYAVTKADETDGLVQRYSAQGLPVLHLLNIKRLVADYGLPYDPERPAAPGQSAVYFRAAYPKLPALAGIAGALALLWWAFRKKGREDEP